MSADCKNKNPLQRSGTSQYKRVLDALLPAYARVDEREYADLILFAKKYAAYLGYYDFSNRLDGNWEIFMKMDVSVVLATIAKQDANIYYQYITSIYAEISKLFYEKKAGYEAEMEKQYKYIYDFVTTLIYQLDEHLDALPSETGFKESLTITIKSRLAELNYRLDKYYNASVTEAMLDNTSTSLPEDAPIKIQLTQDLRINGLSTSWKLLFPPTFNPPIHGATPDVKIRNTINHSVFKGIIESFFKVYSLIIKSSKKYLDETLENFPTHSPHYALFLTFIKLFKLVQNDLNRFTDRHLKLYYKEILSVKPADADPDKAFLLFELQKNIESHLLKKDTIFKGGKDKSGKELFYGLTEDIVVNKGSVKSIKSLFGQQDTSGGKAFTTLFSAPISKSGDGKGGKFTSADNSWKPFGDPESNDTAKIGFAIAHQILFMKEGTRKIEVSITGNDYSKLSGINEVDFTASLTGEKGWQDATITDVKVESGLLKFKLQLGKDASPIVSYDEKIHAAGYAVALPVLQIFVSNVKDQFNYINPLSELIITSISLEVDVKGVKDLMIQNDLGVLNPAKPFQIFGAQPHIGSTFTVGSNEVFLKNTSATVNATLRLEWDKTDRMEGAKYFADYVDKDILIKYLKNGSWENISGSNQHQTVFEHTDPYVNGVWLHSSNKDKILLDLPHFDHDISFEKTYPYTVQSMNGYMQLEFRGPTDFGHGDYIKRFTAASIAKTTLPDEPYTPSVKSITLDYLASATISLTTASKSSFTDKKGYFLHINPYGNSFQHRFILGSSANIELLPSFDNEGEIYIGIENFKASQSLNLLFKVSEGSADPSKERQDIEWRYLSANNIWKSYDKGSVIDGTNDLTKSGIIKFGFPDDATSANTLMGEQLFWVRGVVKKDSSAICNLIDIHAQAATAQLTDYYKTGVEYTNILPDSTITKLLTSDSAIKKITQPYSSFDGEVKEPDGKFYTRVSERLRHKQRGITMWDYERLVLQEFSEIYKVKCINHAKLNSTGSVNELMPGYVLVVPIPDLKDKNAIDPLRPQTSIGTLIDIKEFLQKHISPFVRLDVKNALFEEIQLDFKVKFNTDDGAFYHDLLMDEIEQFLSPWAFDPTKEIEFGGKISKSKLLNFIEEHSYVDYLTCFKMYHIVNGVKSSDKEEAVATSPRSIFVSYGGDGGDKSKRHLINYENPDCNC